MADTAADPRGPVPAAPAEPGPEDRPAVQELLAGAEARRDRLGRKVREAWLAWASQQPHARPEWLDPWEQLDKVQQEPHRLIGEALAAEGRQEACNGITWDTTCLNCSTLLDSAYAETTRAEQAEAALGQLLRLRDGFWRRPGWTDFGDALDAALDEVDPAVMGRARAALGQDAPCPRCGGSGQEPDCGDGDDKLRPHLGCRSTGMLGEPVCCGKHAPESGRSGVMPCSQCGGRDG